jgi:hypothetical protein
MCVLSTEIHQFLVTELLQTYFCVGSHLKIKAFHLSNELHNRFSRFIENIYWA